MFHFIYTFNRKKKKNVWDYDLRSETKTHVLSSRSFSFLQHIQNLNRSTFDF